MISGRAVGQTPAAEWHVATDGNDADPGTKEKPFATLQRAQQSARQSSGAGKAVRVILRGGTYYLPETLMFTSIDSGSKDAPVAYQAFEGEAPVISGGVRLTNLNWGPFKKGIYQARLPAGFATDQLFVNGVLQPMARYPNFNPNERIYNGYAADAFGPERVRGWADPTGGFIHAMHAAEWGGFHFRITGKKSENTVGYEGGWQNNRPAGMHPRFRFVENIFEELDAPGEWFVDQKSATLYYYPPAGVDPSTATFEAVRLRRLLEFRGAIDAPTRFIELKGLTFRHAARTFMENKEPLVRSDWTTYRGGAVFYNGAEDCLLEDCFIDQVGGNAVFVNHYNRRVTVRGCHIARAGGNGVAFVGDPESARVPRGWNDRSQSLASLDRAPGPKNSNYPADCLVDDCLIYLTGRVEKQTAPVQIELSQGITVRHCSLYDVPRAAINIGDGCWGGHLIEFCDIFDTVKETGDHGSFNSWGRDRFWNLAGLDLNDKATWEAEQKLPLLDAARPTVIRNNRWRCDHGWDIDLDDGSSNYHLYNNLCLNGGLKLREGFYRIAENNIFINNGFHPHVWYAHSQDVVRRNIMTTDHYLPAGGMPSTPWGREMDYNLVHKPGVAAQPATRLARQSQRDEHSIEADAIFADPGRGDFRVLENSPALKLGFVNFPMNQFGVRKTALKAIARTPETPHLMAFASVPEGPGAKRSRHIWQAQARDISGPGDRSAYGLPDESGVLLTGVQEGGAAAKAGLRKHDVILGCNGRKAASLEVLRALQDAAAGAPLSLNISRKQQDMKIELRSYAYSMVERPEGAGFKTLPLVSGTTALTGALQSNPATGNEPISALIDGKLAENYGPVFGNGTRDGKYKLDLGGAKSIAQINTYSYNQNGNRGRQRFAIYGSHSDTDPGWNVADSTLFTPIAEVDAQAAAKSPFVASSIRQSAGQSLGGFRWLVWHTIPATANAGGENTAYQEFQVIAAP
ncbi:MAG: PDZ domain-containing protein [Verrucomicrobia bacterium]|nr:PDZ domain-containing protein [Verrucomicrobiota bacterium]